MESIWQKLPKPILIQSPMEGVTDTVFRQMISLVGKPSLFFTEFVNTDGLFSDGQKNILPSLSYTAHDTPIIAQIWGNNPKLYTKAAKLIKKLGFSGMDINMGCPDRAIVKQGFCSGLIKNQKLAKEIVLSAKEGAKDLPVSIKTRIGYDKVVTNEWISFLLDLKPAAITIHGRTTKQMYKGICDWEEIKKAVDLRNKIKSDTVIIGNGDVKNYGEMMEKCKTYGVDGVMVGRALLTNIWIFNPLVNPDLITKEEKLKLLKIHLELFEKTYKGEKDYVHMKKYFRLYINGFREANEMRIELMNCKTVNEAMKFLGNSL